MKPTDNYLKIVEYSEEDGCYVGSIPGWIGQCCHGDDELEVYKELQKIAQEWIEIYKQDGRRLPTSTNRKYSGKFLLRTGEELHKYLAVNAMKEGESLNNYVVKKLKKTIEPN